MHRRPTPSDPITRNRPNRAPRRPAPVTAAQLRREHARNLAWFSI